MQKHRWIIGIALVTALALGLRLWGIEWGLPNALHFYSYHTDETRILGVSRPGPDGLNLFAGQFLPHFYNYGSLQLYLINIAVSIVSAYMPAGHAPTGFTHLSAVCSLWLWGPAQSGRCGRLGVAFTVRPQG
jgi:hypothetical protein